MAIITSTFTATGVSSSVIATAADVSISGIASSTVLVQRAPDGTNFKTIETITADGERVIENASGMPMRLECSVFGSGTITYTLVTR